jgi:hypothetical protein
VSETPDRVLLEITIFDLKSQKTGVHVYLPKDMSDEEYLTALASLTQVTNSLAEQSLPSLQGLAEDRLQ